MKAGMRIETEAGWADDIVSTGATRAFAGSIVAGAVFWAATVMILLY